MAKKTREELEGKILDVDASMQGTIAFKDPVNLRINGSFEGKLDTCGMLTIGENATVRANVQGDRILIAGKVWGDIVARESLSIVNPAIVRGNVQTPLISITEGAKIDGQISMSASGRGAEAGEQVLTLEEVARYLEVEASVVEEWARKKKIPAVRDDSGWKFQRSELDRWIQEERVKV